MLICYRAFHSSFQKKHRLSIESYDAIAEASPYFVHARLNSALANIRQGWTTEAQVYHYQTHSSFPKPRKK